MKVLVQRLLQKMPDAIQSLIINKIQLNIEKLFRDNDSDFALLSELIQLIIASFAEKQLQQ